jgi:hypothetical protein
MMVNKADHWLKVALIGVQKIQRIVSNSGVNYPAGIDKNGNIYSLFYLNSVGDVIMVE